MEGSETDSSLLETKPHAIKRASWFADAADIIVLACSFLLTTASIILVVAIFHTQSMAWIPQTPLATPPTRILSLLQRGISALSATVTSAVLTVAARRYILFQLGKGGIRSRKASVYINMSVGNALHHLLRHGIEVPLLLLLAVWVLGLVTGLTVNNAWGLVPLQLPLPLIPSPGPLDVTAPPGVTWADSASIELSTVMSSVCSGAVGATSALINITGLTLTNGGVLGTIYYPPLWLYSEYGSMGFSTSAQMNGFDISMELLSSLPNASQTPTCLINSYASSTPYPLWYAGADNQTLSIVISTTPSDSPTTYYRFNASAIIMDGMLTSSESYTEFAFNGTSSPNVMSNTQWAEDITTLLCNASIPLTAQGTCFGTNMYEVAYTVAYNTVPYNLNQTLYDQLTWSSSLGMAIGAYSTVLSAYDESEATSEDIPVTATLYDFLAFQPQYGVYILITNIVVSVIMMAIVIWLRRASKLGADFLDTTRLLLDPLKKPELFNVSLDATIDALEDPYMAVREDAEFLLTQHRLPVVLNGGEKTRRRFWISKQQ